MFSTLGEIGITAFAVLHVGVVSFLHRRDVGAELAAEGLDHVRDVRRACCRSSISQRNIDWTLLGVELMRERCLLR